MKKYLELRYRLMPYIYTAARETSETGLPMMRAMWLHHSDDPAAVARGDQFFWGRDLLVAPVVEKGATRRQLYLPSGIWYDFWTGSASRAGARSSARSTSRRRRSTCAPARSSRWGRSSSTSDEVVDGPLTLQVYPGADGTSSLYEDDGRSFDYRKGQFMRIETRWDDSGAPAAAGARAGIADAGAAQPRTIEVDGRRRHGDAKPSRSPASPSRCGCERPQARGALAVDRGGRRAGVAVVDASQAATRRRCRSRSRSTRPRSDRADEADLGLVRLRRAELHLHEGRPEAADRAVEAQSGPGVRPRRTTC